ncbi:MAG: hypothetical protein BWY24_00455 [Microgenomates group bacterium ADurb.Bin219]|nr:MAG: hypothetical protein BWY24_00455 [Microgenomates group bacterium ADurb.Bin219]
MEIDQYSKKFIHYYTDDLPSTIVKLVLNNKSFNSLADLGCGDGSILYALGKKKLLGQFSKIYAIDISKDRIANVKRIDGRIKCMVSDVCNISKIKNSEIDLIILNQVIEHVQDDELMIKEIERILKKGGIAYISTVFKKWYGWFFYKDKNNNWVIDPTHEREYSYDKQLIGKFKKFDLEILKNNKSLQWFPITDFFLKRIGFRNDAYERSLQLRLLRKVKIPIIGYYNWEIVCKKK